MCKYPQLKRECGWQLSVLKMDIIFRPAWCLVDVYREKWKDSRKKVTLFFFVMDELSIINVFGLEQKKLQFV